MKLALQNFIINNSNWKELLTSAPYNLKITEEDNLVLFKYSQIDSDFSNPIVKESRGIILEKDTWNIIAYAFNKFFNFGEIYADDIDWDSAIVTSKEDGSIIKVFYYNNKWRVATNGTINAYKAQLNSGKFKTFGELFDVAAENSGLDYSLLDKKYTYIFELVSPYAQIVCPQNETKLFHIGTRNNITGFEEEIDINIEKPKLYKLSSLDDCISMVKTFDFTKEGFVVRDKKYNRIKIKSEDYIKVHRLANNGSLTKERAIELIRENDLDEFFTYFPHYKEYIGKIKVEITELSHTIDDIISIAKLIKEHSLSRADFAARVSKLSSLGKVVSFLTYDEKIESGDQYIASLTTKQIIRYLNKIEE